MREPEPAAAALIGAQLGNYRVVELIGEGGMGQVYLAEHVALGRRVAIKLLRPSLSSNRSAVARFFREAEVVNRIRHRNIVDITDFVELPDASAFIVMELLEGTSLQELHRDRGPLPLPLIVDIVDQVCAALEATHAIGVVHRDLKPGNVFVCADRSSPTWVKLLDFGVAKLGDGELGTGGSGPSAPHTEAGAVLGTPAYMSPEQAVGESLDGRSDVYALGTILYELVCGAPPFTADRFVDYVHMHAAQAPRSPTDTESGRHAPPALGRVIMHCLEKRPERRFQTVTALRAALGGVRTGLARPGRPRRWRGRARLAVAASALVAAGLGAVFVASNWPLPPVAADPAAAAGQQVADEPSAPMPAAPPVVAPVPIATPLDAGPTTRARDASADAPPRKQPRRRRKRTRRAPPSPPGAARPAVDSARAAVLPSAPEPVRRDDGTEVHPGATVNPFKD